jgi:hypothetical protein
LKEPRTITAMASNSDRHHHRALNGHVDRRFAGSPSPGQGQGLLNTVDQNGPASNPFTGTSRRTGEMQHVVVLANSGERKEGATESTFEAIEKELDVVKDHLTMHMHRLKARLAEVKRQEQFQRTVSLDRGRRLNASSSSSSSPPPPSQWTVGPAGADGASDDGRRQSPQKFSQIEPKRMLQENEDATTAAVENRLLRQRIAQLMQREVALTLRADYLEHRLDVQTRIAAATRYRQIRKAATRESGLRKQTAAAIDDSNSHAADAETGIESCRGSIPGWRKCLV